MHTTPVLYEIAVPDADLFRLEQRLTETRWATDFGNEDWTYGVEREWLERMVDYWSTGYNWRSQERLMNQWPQYLVQIDGVPVHFLWIRGTNPDSIPIILTHGWPWTFWDFKDMIGPLSDPASHGVPGAPSFDVIIPSLPGMGFSAPLTTTGLDTRRIAHIWAELMRDVLGYELFAAAGSDWGAGVTSELAHCYPEALIGIWTSFPVFPGMIPTPPNESSFAPDERWMLEQMARASRYTQAHFAVGMFEPQTIAYALVDSPVGTAAWIWSRRRDSSDHDGDVLDVFDRDFMCTTASIYWLTGTIATSMRIYHEHFTQGPPGPLRENRPLVDVPTGVGIFPKDNLFLPQAKVSEMFDLRRWKSCRAAGTSHSVSSQNCARTNFAHFSVMTSGSPAGARRFAGRLDAALTRASLTRIVHGPAG